MWQASPVPAPCSACCAPGCCSSSGAGARCSPSTSCSRRWRSSARCASCPSRRTRRLRGSTWSAPLSPWSGLVVLVFSIIEAPTYGWAAGAPSPGSPAARGPGGLRVRRAASPAPAAGPAHLHPPPTVGGQRVDLRAVLRVLRVRVRVAAVPPARPWRLGPAFGPADAAHGSGDDADRASRAGGSSRVFGAGGVRCRAGADLRCVCSAWPRWTPRAPTVAARGGLVPIGVGMGAAMTPATSAITESLPARSRASGRR